MTLRIISIGLVLIAFTAPLANANAASTVDEFETALAAGQIDVANKKMQAALDLNPDHQQARFALGVGQFLHGVEGLAQSLHKYGMFGAERHRQIPFLRLPIPNNPTPQEVSYEDLRKVLQQFQADLKTAEATLAKVDTKDVKLPLHVGKFKMDFNADGKVTDDESFWKIFQTYNARVRREEAIEFAIAFDGGDVHWLRGYCNLLLGTTDVLLAHDFHEIFERCGHLAFAKPKTPHKFLLEEEYANEEGVFNWDWRPIADAIAAIHSTNFPVVEPKRMQSAHANFLVVIEQSRKSWDRILAETDDDYEWLPNPKQTGVIPGVRVSEEMITSWGKIMDESEAILQGKKLVPFWRGYKEGPKEVFAKGIGVNINKVFMEPRDFDLVLWVTGTGATPYLEKGELSDPRSFERMTRAFGGQFIGFAFWFN